METFEHTEVLRKKK